MSKALKSSRSTSRTS